MIIKCFFSRPLSLFLYVPEMIWQNQEQTGPLQSKSVICANGGIKQTAKKIKGKTEEFRITQSRVIQKPKRNQQVIQDYGLHNPKFLDYTIQSNPK